MACAGLPLVGRRAGGVGGLPGRLGEHDSYQDDGRPEDLGADTSTDTSSSEEMPFSSATLLTLPLTANGTAEPMAKEDGG